MRIIKSLENFKKIFEDDKSTQSTQIQTQVKPEQAKPAQGAVQGQQRPESKEYYYKGKKIEGVVKDEKLVSKVGNIKLEEVKEFGQKINKIQELKPYFYYIQNIDNINYRIIKVVGVKDNVVKIVFQKNNQEIKEEIDFIKIKLFKTNPEKQDEKGYAQSKKTKEDSQSQEDATNIKTKIEKSKNIEDLPKEEINKVLKAGENDKETKVKIINKDGKEVEVSLADAIKQLRSEMSTQKSNESYNQGKYKIFEETGSIEYNSVKNIWRGFFEEMDKKETMTLSQREVDEMDKLIGSGKDKLSLNVSKRPDPIVNITKIYTRAHELYYTDIIPSGRPKGRVSVKTAREYIQLGKPSYPIDPDDPIKGGPYAVKVLFRKWRNGVLTILQDQSYRKILANIDFVVPGAKDKFNPEGTSVEPKDSSRDTERGLKRGESTGQILFEYMTDMLNPKKLDDFEGLQSELLNKYFGIDRKKSDLGEIKPTTTTKEKTTKSGDVMETYLKWFGLEDFKAFIDRIGSGGFKPGNVVLIHFVDENNKKYMMIGDISRNNSAGKKIEFRKVEFVSESENSETIKSIVNQGTYTVGNIKPTNTPKTVSSSGNMEAEITVDPSNKNKFKLKIIKNAPTIFSTEKEYDVTEEGIDKTENAIVGDSKTSVRILQKYEASSTKYVDFIKT